MQNSFAPAKGAGLDVQFGGAAGEDKEEAGGTSELIGTGILRITLMTAFTTLGSTVTALAAMLGLAVGIDYALHRLPVQDRGDQRMELEEAAWT